MLLSIDQHACGICCAVLFSGIVLRCCSASVFRGVVLRCSALICVHSCIGLRLLALLALLSAPLAGCLTGYMSALLVGCLAGCLLLLLLQGRISLSYNENALVCFIMHVAMSCTS